MGASCYEQVQDITCLIKSALPSKEKAILVMKIIPALLFLMIFQVRATTFAQNISLNKTNASLKEIFSEIRSQSGFDFLLQVNDTERLPKLTISVTNKPLNEVLTGMFANTSLDFLIKDRTILIVRKKNSVLDRIASLWNNIKISGTVLDENEQPMIGATVRAVASKKYAYSDKNGQFILDDVDENDSLSVSFLGYKTIIISVKQSLKRIIMVPLTNSLQEVTVTTGYQSLLKERAPGAYDQVKQDVLSRRPVSNLSTALQGMVAGMQAKENADGSVNFLIRGNSSLYADRAPLVVVDGFPLGSSDFSTINPNDVENVTVLKDASAASIWGARSANGVIVITTKKGKLGAGLKIDANVFTRFSAMPDLDQLLLTASSNDHVAMEKLAFQNNWYFGSSNYSGAFATSLNQPLTLVQELLYANKNGKLSTPVMNSKLDSLAAVSNGSQISDLLFQRQVLTQYNINFSAGSEKSKSYGSLLFEDNRAKFQGNGSKRYALNFNNDYNPAKFINLNVGLFLQHRDISNSGATLNELAALSPYETLTNSNGSYSTNLLGQNREIVAGLPMASFPYSDWSYNLLRETRGRNFNTKDYNARIQAGASISIFKGLSFDSKIQYERTKNEVNNYYSDDTYFVRNIANLFVEYNNNTRVVGKTFVPKGGILQSNTTDQSNYVFRNQLNFNRDLGSKHSLNVIAGMEISQYKTDSKVNPWLYGYYPEKLQSSVPQYGYGTSVSPVTHVLGVNTTFSALLGANSGAGGNTTLNYLLDRYVSYYANAAYTYDGKYTLSGSIRTDASNFITEISTLRWEPMWSVGGLWNIKREKFVNGLPWVDRLSLRVTYGRNGNVEKSSSTNTLLSVGSSLNANTGTITATIADNGNPTLRWEKTTTANIGVDFGLFRGRLYGKVDFYNKRGSDITGLVALSSVTGTTSQRFNNAIVINRGAELELGTSLTIADKLNYSTSLNYAYNFNQVESLYNPSLTAAAMVTSATAFVEGRPVNPIYTYTYGGTVSGVPQVVGPAGTLYTMNSSGAAILTGTPFLNYRGTATPPHTLGWYNSFRYGGFQLSALILGKFGGVYRNPAFNYESLYVGSSKIVLNRYAAEVLAGRADIPGLPKLNETLAYNWSRYTTNLDGLVESSSYIEAKEITLDYTFPKKQSTLLGLQNLKVYTQVRDLGLIWQKNTYGYNPDWLPGTDRPLRSFTLGINATF